MAANTEQEVFDQIETLLEELSVIDTTKRGVEVEKDERIKAIVDEFAPKIDPLTTRHGELMEQLAQLFVENESWLTSSDNKTAVFRSGTMKSHTSPGALIVDDEELAIDYLRKKHILRAFTRRAKLTLDKVRLKKHPELVAKIPGVWIDVPEFLSIRLIRTKIELKEDLKPYRRRVA